jgi:hypothetical protein
MRRLRALGVVLLGVLTAASAQAASKAEALLKIIKTVGREGAGNAEAARAWKDLVALGPEALLDILAAMDDRDPVTSNWLGAAAEAIVEKDKEFLARRNEVTAFIARRSNPGVGRRLAFEMMARFDALATARMLRKMLDDPDPELRRAAVALALSSAEAWGERGRELAGTAGGVLTVAVEAAHFVKEKNRPTVVAAYRQALAGAVDQDQVEAAARALKPLGVDIDLARHFGVVRRWQLVTPFDNGDGVGFKAVYPPEKGVDVKVVYNGKDDEDARWSQHVARDPLGNVDLNKVLGKKKGVVAYAFAVVEATEAREVEIRSGSPNALKIFLNGKEVFTHEEYHHGMRLDQFVCRGNLKKGRNEILVKICQNEQSEVWAQSWIFQVRLCNATGEAVPFSQPEKE